MPRSRSLAAASVALASLVACGSEERADVLRVGHFPNVTHAQGVVAHARSKAGKGWFESRTGMREIRWYVYNAGPSAMEAMLAGNLDLAYVGPNPAINAHVKTGGDEVRVVAGSARGGAALVVAKDSPIRTAADFRGKTLATPQFGNTQDVAARAWLTEGGLRVTQTGGDARVVPTENPDQLGLFKQGELDGVWTVEPWLSRLVVEGGGRVLVEEADALTTVLVVRRKVLETRRDVVERFVAAHAELTRWIAEHGDEARRETDEALRAQTGASLPPAVLEQGCKRLRFDASVDRAPFDDFLRRAKSAGFLREAPPLDRLVEPLGKAP